MQNSDEVLEIALGELRLIYTRLTTDNSANRLKALTFLGGGLAFASYLYGDRSFFFPAQTYGQIFYVIGFCLFAVGLGAMFYLLRGINWMVPVESTFKSMVSQYGSKNGMLQHLVTEYTNAMAGNLPVYERKQKILNLAFPALLAGAIILIVIKKWG